MPEQVNMELECAGIGKAENLARRLRRRGFTARQRDREVHVTVDARFERDVRDMHAEYV